MGPRERDLPVKSFFAVWLLMASVSTSVSVYIIYLVVMALKKYIGN